MGWARTIYGALAAVVLLAVGVPILVPSMATLVTLILAKSIVVLGIMGEYLNRVFTQTKARPLYIVDEAIGF